MSSKISKGIENQLQKLDKLPIKNTSTPAVRRLCAWIVGAVYFGGGILKLIDPTGAGLVMEEYFKFLHLPFLLPMAKHFGVALALFEAILGLALITGVFRKVVAIIVSIVQLIFTGLTLALVIINPIMDCGCFGEAIHLTHLQTFLKNVILIVLILCAFAPYKKFGRPKKKKYFTFILTSLATIAFMLHALYNLPLVDFTMFKPGTQIMAAKDNYVDGAAYESVFIYEKEGEKEAFTLENLPDSTWSFVETQTKQLELGYDAPIFSFYDRYGEYKDELAAEDNLLVINIYNPGIPAEKWKEIYSLTKLVRESGFRVLIVLRSEPSDVEGLLEDLNPEIRMELQNIIYFSDYKTLITINRSNAGLTLLNKGYIICKWKSTKYPSIEDLDELYDSNEVETTLGYNVKGSLYFQGFLLLMFAIIILI